MHGIIMNQFRRFVIDRLGRDAWPELTRAAEVPLPDEPLTLGTIYPDEYLAALLPVASRTTGIPVEALLEDFGVYLAPTLLRVYEPLILSHWRALDVIENTEQVIHTVVRLQNPGASPPFLQARRVSPDEVVVDYTSPRRLCAVAKGIGRGMGQEFGEEIVASEVECMYRGNPCCRLSFRRLGGSG